MIDSTGSYIKGLVERARFFYENDSDKFTDSWVVQNLVSEAYAEIWNLINKANQDPVLLWFDVTLASGTSDYILPPTVAEVWAMAKRETDNQGVQWVTQYWRPEDGLRLDKYGWRLSGNRLHFDTPPDTDETWSIAYVPSGDVAMHYATTGTLAAGGATFTLAASPSVGLLDRRENAYVGQVLRFLPVSGVHQERTIVAYNASTRVATLDVAFSGTSAGAGADPYEVGLPGLNPLSHSLAARVAIMFAARQNAEDKRFKALHREKEAAYKTVADLKRTKNVATGPGWKTSTVADFREDRF